jgi:hypothetical protein
VTSLRFRCRFHFLLSTTRGSRPISLESTSSIPQSCKIPSIPPFSLKTTQRHPWSFSRHVSCTSWLRCQRRPNPSRPRINLLYNAFNHFTESYLVFQDVLSFTSTFDVDVRRTVISSYFKALATLEASGVPRFHVNLLLPISVPLTTVTPQPVWWSGYQRGLFRRTPESVQPPHPICHTLPPDHHR